MLDVTPLLAAVDRFADRLRAAPESRLRRGAATEALSLARELSTRAQRAETPDTPPREMPDAGAFAVADQVAVAGRDLAEALRTGAAPADGLEEAVGLVEGAVGRAFG
ncbi:hypothetical protein [Streptomyces melanogenes]|uniref:hypothetical protein n=1 Tax=Streptomyces melanogenes TaxID=67326 RepID=UPI00167E2E25|nr:hypothetical protein [Streptomyces melanogenes]GGP37867.1 hypothetical protein GCM10010278_13550 [Streptomyces melanogenes]